MNWLFYDVLDIENKGKNLPILCCIMVQMVMRFK